MKSINGVIKLHPNINSDSRGVSMDYLYKGFNMTYSLISQNYRRGTLRGLHFQTGEKAQSKLIRCLNGKIFDVVVDLRPDSPTYLNWHGEYLTNRDFFMLYIPKGCAHGFITLESWTDVFYQIEGAYDASSSSGIRWNDSRFGIIWPEEVKAISEQDTKWPDWI